MLLSLLQFVAGSTDSHISIQQLAFQRIPQDWKIALKQAEHLAWFSYLLNSTLELIWQNNSTPPSWERIHLVRNQLCGSGHYNSCNDQTNACDLCQLLLNQVPKRDDEFRCKLHIHHWRQLPLKLITVRRTWLVLILKWLRPCIRDCVIRNGVSLKYYIGNINFFAKMNP